MNRIQVESNSIARSTRINQRRHPDDAHLSAYNAAFSDLGLRFRWDRATFDILKEFNGEGARMTAFIERYHGHLHHA